MLKEHNALCMKIRAKIVKTSQAMKDIQRKHVLD